MNGTKWAANLWVWNAPRIHKPFAPLKKGHEGPLDPNAKIYITFRNENNNPLYERAELFWKDKKSYGTLGPGKSFRARTYKGHEWNIKVDGETILTYVISGEEEDEVFVF